jgi:hypothetical protein
MQGDVMTGRDDRKRLIRRSEPQAGIVAVGGQAGIGLFYGGQLGAVAYPPPEWPGWPATNGVARTRLADHPTPQVRPYLTSMQPLRLPGSRIQDLLTNAAERYERPLENIDLVHMSIDESRTVVGRALAVVAAVVVVDVKTTGLILRHLGIG